MKALQQQSKNIELISCYIFSEEDRHVFFNYSKKKMENKNAKILFNENMGNLLYQSNNCQHL